MSGAIERFLAARVADGWMPGAAWWVERSGSTIDAGALGHAATVPTHEPLSEATPFDLASLTKPLATATLLALAEQDGMLSLESPAGEYLDELAGSTWRDVTLLALATHTSGLPAWKPLCVELSSTTGFVEAIVRTPRAVRAGETLYSDLGYILLGEVLLRVTGEPLDRLFKKRVAEPLRLRRTGFATTPGAFVDAAATEIGNRYERDLAGPSGAGHRWREGPIRGEVHDANAFALGGVAGHAGLFAPIDEVARLGQELLRPRDLPLGERARNRLLDVAVGTGGRTAGFVMARGSSAAAGILPDEAPGHTGFTGTSIWLDPPRERLFVLLTNRVHPRVAPRNFQLVRRGFHRLARRAG